MSEPHFFTALEATRCQRETPRLSQGRSPPLNWSSMREHFDDYATRFPDQYVLICGQELIGVFPTRREAIDEGYRLGVRKMLVRECGTRPEPVFMPTLLRASGPRHTAA